jgi:putative intracellular protease/amidase
MLETAAVDIVFYLFDRITVLDAVGPYEVLSNLPGAKVTFTGERVGEVRSDRKLGLMVDVARDDVDRADILVFPGGGGTRPLMSDEPTLAWVRRIHETTKWTTSVCTGALVLGAAGLLQGVRATTFWRERELLATLGATVVHDRVVRDGKIVTAAGVSSGIDMALTLAGWECGDEIAQAIQLGIEYDPQPPYDSGSPEKASPEVLARFR